MRKKTFWSILIPSLCTLIISVLVITGITYADSHSDVIEEIRYQAEYLSKAVNEIDSYGEDPFVFLDRIGKPSEHRITLISRDGEVLYDNFASPSEMVNHADRPEFEDAISDGRGEATRASDTIGNETYYYAIRLESGNILRLATSVANGLGAFASAAIITVPIAAILALISFIIAIILSKSLSKPLRNLNFDNPMSNHTYEELTPMLRSIEKKNSEIADRMEELTRRRSEFDSITANMSEGIVILSSDGVILSANKSARSILSIERGALYTDLSDSDDVIGILKSAFNGSRTIGNISRPGKIYRLTATPVTNLYGEYSVVLLVLDVTSSEQVEGMRREFSANVSHELKTPLTTILGYAEIISNGVARSEDVPTFAEQIHSEASRLLTLIEDIIKLSRLDEKNLIAQFEETNLYELCDSVANRLSEKAERLGIDLSFEGEEILVNGIRPVLYEIIFNLADNALTYNRPGGSVKIRLYSDDMRPVLSVADTGIGIAEEDQARVFERFYRVDKSHSKETGGTGLGLSIVKHGVMLHSAEIKLQSRLGEGTTVSVIF